MPRAGDGLPSGQLHAVKMTDGTGRSDLGRGENPDQSYDDDPAQDAGNSNISEVQWKLLAIARRSRGMPQRVGPGLLLSHLTVESGFEYGDFIQTTRVRQTH